MAYWSPQALNALAASESGGNASLIHYPNNVAWGGSSRSGSSASGLYGYTTSTWQTYAPQAGVDINQYPYAYMAPASVQSQVVAVTPISNWTCPGCNSTASALAANPANISDTPMTGGTNFTAPGTAPDYFTTSTTPGAQTSYPITDGSSGFGTDNQTPGGVDPVTGQPDMILPDVNVGAPTQFQSGTSTGGTNPSTSATGAQAQPGQGTPVQVNLGPQTASDLQSWVNAPINAAENAVSGWFAQMQNWFGRGFLILIGIVVVGIALWKATGGPSTTQIIEAVK